MGIPNKRLERLRRLHRRQRFLLLPPLHHIPQRTTKLRPRDLEDLEPYTSAMLCAALFVQNCLDHRQQSRQVILNDIPDNLVVNPKVVVDNSVT
jgi:hypothetical protein